MTRLQIIAVVAFIAQAATAYLLSQGSTLLAPQTLLVLGAVNAALGASLLVLPSVKSSATIVRPAGDIEVPK